MDSQIEYKKESDVKTQQFLNKIINCIMDNNDYIKWNSSHNKYIIL